MAKHLSKITKTKYEFSITLSEVNIVNKKVLSGCLSMHNAISLHEGVTSLVSILFRAEYSISKGNLFNYTCTSSNIVLR